MCLLVRRLTCTAVLLLAASIRVRSHEAAAASSVDRELGVLSQHGAQYGTKRRPFFRKEHLDEHDRSPDKMQHEIESAFSNLFTGEHLPVNKTAWASTWQDIMRLGTITAGQHFSQHIRNGSGAPQQSVRDIMSRTTPGTAAGEAQLAYGSEYRKLHAGEVCPFGTTLATKLQCEVAASKLGHLRTTVNLEDHDEQIPTGCSAGKNVLAWSAKSASHQRGHFEPICAAPPVLPRNLKLIVGVLSCPSDDYARQVIRTTWFNQPGVCTIDKASSPRHFYNDCTVYVVFVIGGVKESYLMRDELFLAVPDGKSSDGGVHVKMAAVTRKVSHFLRWASEHYPWASHIGRVDQDFFPKFHYVLPAIAEKTNQYQYLGNVMNDSLCTHTMKDVLGNVRSGQFVGIEARVRRDEAEKEKQGRRRRRDEYPKEGGCYCLFGPMYFLSRQLAVAITDGSYDKQWNVKNTLDDQVLGCVVSEFVHRHKVAVDTFDDADQSNAVHMARTVGLLGVNR